ncbi:MAG: hypothetical protein IBX55_01495 [Methyloprofundus sp.]|nr:hypothetical protein [Methyloprofundus sp.]
MGTTSKVAIQFSLSPEKKIEDAAIFARLESIASKVGGKPSSRGIVVPLMKAAFLAFTDKELIAFITSGYLPGDLHGKKDYDLSFTSLKPEPSIHSETSGDQPFQDTGSSGKVFNSAEPRSLRESQEPGLQPQVAPDVSPSAESGSATPEPYQHAESRPVPSSPLAAALASRNKFT